MEKKEDGERRNKKKVEEKNTKRPNVVRLGLGRLKP